jgi:hypothetical protein
LAHGLFTANFVKPCSEHSDFFTKIPFIGPYEASTIIKLHVIAEKSVIVKGIRLTEGMETKFFKRANPA